MRLPALVFGQLALVLALAPHTVLGQSNDSLVEEVLLADSAVFAAFNAREIDQLLPYFSRDLEFFHDTDGLSDYNSFVDSSRRLFSSEHPPTRTLVPGSVTIHPIPGYGAIQIGAHEFCHVQNGAQDCGTFGFTHVWRQDNERWQITRVLSYGH